MRLSFPKSLTIIFGCIFLVTGFEVIAKPCTEGFLEIKQGANVSIIKVEIADTVKKRHVGLMYRDKLSYRSGMLFVYDEPTNAKFWMKNTLIPLDIAFAVSKGLVKYVKYLALPNDLSIIEGGKDIRYVVEVEAGTARLINLSEGAFLRSNRFGLEAAWPC